MTRPHFRATRETIEDRELQSAIYYAVKAEARELFAANRPMLAELLARGV